MALQIEELKDRLQATMGSQQGEWQLLSELLQGLEEERDRLQCEEQSEATKGALEESVQEYAADTEDDQDTTMTRGPVSEGWPVVEEYVQGTSL